MSTTKKCQGQEYTLQAYFAFDTQTFMLRGNLPKSATQAETNTEYMAPANSDGFAIHFWILLVKILFRPGEAILLSVIISIGLFFLLREVFCWYWKINARLAVQECNEKNTFGEYCKFCGAQLEDVDEE